MFGPHLNGSKEMAPRVKRRISLSDDSEIFRRPSASLRVTFARNVFLDRHDVVACVNGYDRAGDAAGESAAEEQGCLGNLIHCNIPLQGGFFGGVVVHIPEAAYPPGR